MAATDTKIGRPRQFASKIKVGKVVLPAIALAAIFTLIFIIRPNAFSYNGLHVLLRLSPVLIFASMAQLFIIAASDIDLSIGPFVAMINAIVVAILPESLLFGTLALGAAIAAYGLMGAIVQVLRLPSILVTLAASFVWFGVALLVLPQAGGRSPEWLISFARLKPPLAPLPVYIAIACALAGYYILRVHSYGAIMRGLGNNPEAVTRAGRSALRARVTLYMLAGSFGVLAGMAISGLSTTGDPNVGRAITLLSIAAVIIGGSEFVGGEVSPSGAVIGALIMLMTASTLTFLSVPSDWQFSVQGGMLIVVLAARATVRMRRHD